MHILRLVTHAQVHIIGRTHPNRILCNALRDSDLATRKQASGTIRRIVCENIINRRLILAGHVNLATRAVFRGIDNVINGCGVVVWIKTCTVQLVSITGIFALEYVYLVFGFRTRNVARITSLKRHYGIRSSVRRMCLKGLLDAIETGYTRRKRIGSLAFALIRLTVDCGLVRVCACSYFRQ